MSSLCFEVYYFEGENNFSGWRWASESCPCQCGLDRRYSLIETLLGAVFASQNLCLAGWWIPAQPAGLGWYQKHSNVHSVPASLTLENLKGNLGVINLLSCFSPKCCAHTPTWLLWAHPEFYSLHAAPAHTENRSPWSFLWSKHMILELNEKDLKIWR